MEQDNRESWLNRVAIGMAPLFDALDTPLPSRVRVAIGFTSRGAKGRAIGECWDNRRSGDGHFEIFIRPDLAHAPDAMPAQIAAVLAHELVHAAVGIAAGHGKAFKRVAVGLGLHRPMQRNRYHHQGWLHGIELLKAAFGTQTFARHAPAGIAIGAIAGRGRLSVPGRTHGAACRLAVADEPRGAARRPSGDGAGAPIRH